MNFTTKILSILILNLTLSIPTYASKKMENLYYKADVENLNLDDIHYFSELLTVRSFLEKYPELEELDTQNCLQKGNIQIFVGKAAYIVNKPVGFFDHQHTIDEKFLSHTSGNKLSKNKEENSFKVQSAEDKSYSFQMKTYFDSDDISTLPNSRIIQAVSRAKKLDVISQSASSTVFKEFSGYTKYSKGGSTVSTFIPLKENKTLIISYTLTTVKKPYLNEKKLEESFKDEVLFQKKMIESYK